MIVGNNDPYRHADAPVQSFQGLIPREKSRGTTQSTLPVPYAVTTLAGSSGSASKRAFRGTNRVRPRDSAGRIAPPWEILLRPVRNLVSREEAWRSAAEVVRKERIMFRAKTPGPPGID